MAARAKRTYITELHRAFARLAAGVSELKLEVVGQLREDTTLVHPVAGFEVVLRRAEGDGAAVALYVSAAYAELAIWPNGVHAEQDEALREPFAVNLAGEYGWGDTVFPSADELAAALLGYMQYRLDTVGSGST